MSIPRKVPQSPDAWVEKITLLGLAKESIHRRRQVQSGSKFSWEDYLLLRIIWNLSDQKQNPRTAIIGKWIQKTHVDVAVAFLAQNAGMMGFWEAYLKSIDMSRRALAERGYDGLGTFALVRYHQIQSDELPDDKVSGLNKISPPKTRSQTKAAAQTSPTPQPRRPPHTPPNQSELPIEELAALHLLGATGSSVSSSVSSRSGNSLYQDDDTTRAIQDEQIVNVALIDYLSVLTIHCKDLKADWTIHRLGFKATNSQREKTYEARIDGYLRRRSDGNPLVIVEVKPYKRKASPLEVRMQESAQMAAWLNRYPTEDIRLLISQDRHEIYLTFAKANRDYIDYIKDGKDLEELMKIDPRGGLLTMDEYGPFSVNDKKAMRGLGELVLAYGLQACSYKV